MLTQQAHNQGRFDADAKFETNHTKRQLDADAKDRDPRTAMTARGIQRQFGAYVKLETHPAE